MRTSTLVSAMSICPLLTLLLDQYVFPLLHFQALNPLSYSSLLSHSLPLILSRHLTTLPHNLTNIPPPTQIETVIFPEQAEIKSVKIYAKTENHTDASTVPLWLRVVPNTEMGDAYTVKLISGKDAEKLATAFKFHNAEGQLKATFKSRHGIDVVTDLLSYIPSTPDGVTRNDGPVSVAFRHLTDNEAKESLWEKLKVFIGEDWNKNEDPTDYNYVDMISSDVNPYNMWTSCNDQLGVATRTWKNDYLKGVLAKHPDPERTLSCSLAKLYPVSADEIVTL